MSAPGGATRWWWIRHAPVPDGGRIYGQRDLDCDCTDAAVFRVLARELPEGAVWFTSNLARTRQTAAAIVAAAQARFAGIAPIPVAGLAEQHLGAWQGLERSSFYAARGVGTRTLWFAPADERPPGGESFADLIARVSPAIQRLTQEHDGRDIVSISHGGTIRAALALALGLTPQSALSFTIDNCSLTRIDHLGEFGGRSLWRVGCVNHRPWPRSPASGLAHNAIARDKA
jgi:broad specificity phosphatase PhoE